jgi:hypothetical protein
MDDSADTTDPTSAARTSPAGAAPGAPAAPGRGDAPAPPPGTVLPPSAQPASRTRLPSTRASLALAAAMLVAGVAVGAAIGPAPEASLAGGADIVQKLPALIAGVAARERAQPAAHATSAPPPITPQPTPAATPAASAPATASTPTTTASAPTPAASEPTSPAAKPKSGGASKLPPITSVWLIQLAGGSFTEALASPAAAPVITGQLIPGGTLLSGWSALDGSGFASDAALSEHRPTVGSAPPILHSIVQPPCPEGAAGAACSSGPGQLTAADEFLKATLATITNTTTYSEHGLVVITFATVANPTASELPAGSSGATLTSQPPAGVVLLSPFVTAGAKSSVAFNATSPKQSLETLLH